MEKHDIIQPILIAYTVTIFIVFCVVIYRQFQDNKYYKLNNIQPPPILEGFYDLVPYDLNWDMFKCLDPWCIKNKSYTCYNYCDNIKELGAQENCRMRCLDYADQTFDSLKFQNYTFNSALTRFYDKKNLDGLDSDFINYYT